MTDSLNVVGIFAHPDDELNCAGTLANHSDRGDNVQLIFLTKGEGTSKMDEDLEEIKHIRKEQAKNAADVLNAEVEFLDIPDTEVLHTQPIIKQVATSIKEHQPDILITWNQPTKPGTGHPDHRNTYDIVLDAITHARFENTHNGLSPHRERISLYTLQHYESNPEDLHFIDVTHQYDRIMEFIESYKDIFGEWNVVDHKETLLKYFGQYCYVDYAEALKKITWRRGGKYLD